MARRLNKRVAAFIAVFIGVPMVLAILYFGGVFGGQTPEFYKQRAREFMDRGEWPQAWITIRNAIKYGGGKDPETRYMLGQIAIEQVPPAWGPARQAFESAVILNPEYFEAQRDLTELNVKFREWQDAKKAAARLLEMDPSFGKGYLWAAMAEWGLAQNQPIFSNRVPFYEAAAERLVAGIEKAPDLMDLYGLLAVIYKELDQPDKIMEVMDLAIANNPLLPQAYTMKAGLLITMAQLDEADGVLREGLLKVPDAPILLLALGEVAANGNDADGAKEFFQKAIQADPKTEGAYLRLSNLYRVEGNAAAALEALGKGLEALPASAALKVEQADILLEQREVEKAGALLTELAEAMPESAEVDYLRGKQALLDRRTRQAIDYLEQARSKKPTPQTLLLLGRAYLVAGELGAARKELEALVAAYPAYVGARRSLADVQLRLREYDLAIWNADQVLQATPGDVDMRLLMAEAYLAQGKPDVALKEAKAAVEQAPSNPAPLFLTARLYRGMNRNAEAEADLRRILQLDKANERAYQELIALYQATDQSEKLARTVEEVRVNLPDSLVSLAVGPPDQLEQELKQRIAAGASPVRDRILLGRVYLMTDRAEQAREVLQKVLDEAEAGSDAWRQVWQLLFMQELSESAYEKAADLVRRMEKVDPEATELLFADALVALGQNRLDEATDELKAIIEKNQTLSSAYYLLGQVLASQRQWEESAAELQKALDVRPDLVAARVLLGRIYQSQGNNAAALIEAGEALKFAPRYVPALALQAESHARNNAWDAAIKARQAIAEIVPNDLANRANLASLYLRRGDPKEAERIFSEVYKVAPDNGWLVQQFAGFYVQTNRPDQGRELVAQYVAAHPDDAGAYLLRGTFTATTAGLDQARPDYEKAAGLLKDEAQPLVLLGDAYVARGRLDEAAAVYQKAALRPKDGDLARKRLADVYMLQMKLNEAEATIQQVLKGAPEDAQAMVVAGRIAARRKDFAKAKEWMDKALAATPNYGEAKFWLAQLYRSSEPEKSFDLLGAVDQSDPSFEKALLLRSAINMRRGQFAEAAMDLRRLIDFRPASVPAHRALAQLYMTTNEPRRASAILEELVQQYRTPALLTLLGDALVAQRRFSDALKRYEEARAIQPELPEALIGEASCLVALNRKSEALERVQHVMNVVLPNEAWPRLALATVYEGTNEPAKAVEALQNGLLKHPDWEMGYVRLASMLSRLAAGAEGPQRDQRIAEARGVLLEGLGKLPGSVNLRTSLAAMDIEGGDYESVKRILEPVAKRFKAENTGAPEDVDRLRGFLFPVRIYALALYYTGQANEAIAWATMLWNLDPLDAANANNLAYILATEGKDLARAQDLVRRCLRLMPNSPQVLDTAGWVAFLQGEDERATAYLLESLSRGESPEAHYHLGRVHEKVDRPEEALEQYQKAIELGLMREERLDAEKRIDALRKQRPS